MIGRSGKIISKNKDLPRHIAIIMDGNGRWAKKRGLPRIEGHRNGIKSVREIVEACGELGIKILTLYTFSTENWRRPRREVSGLMRLLVRTTNNEINDLVEKNVKLIVSGDLSSFPKYARNTVLKAVDKTKDNTGLILNLALGYGGREELIRAVRKIANEVREGKLDPERIDQHKIQENLYTAGLPDPDLLIRTSGEFRVSNFLLWQIAYTEFYITTVLWPDFRKKHLYRAIEDYLGRERRFGKTSEQL